MQITQYYQNVSEANTANKMFTFWRNHTKYYRKDIKLTENTTKHLLNYEDLILEMWKCQG